MPHSSCFVSRLNNILGIVILVGVTAKVSAQQDLSPAALETKSQVPNSQTKESKPLGWTSPWNVSSGVNAIENRNVIGQADGSTTIYSLKLNAAWNRTEEFSRWNTSLGITETFSRTPAVPRLVKTGDDFTLNSIYKNYFESMEWAGYYARGQIQTALLDGYDERGSTVTYSITDSDEVVTTEEAERLKLTDGGKPLTLKESIGILAKIIERKSLSLEYGTGFGARQIFADGQFVVDDLEDTEDLIEVRELRDVTIVGWEHFLEFVGTSHNGKVSYKLYAEALVPLSYSPRDDDDPEPTKLTSTELGAQISYGLLEWMALSYDFKSKREPLLLNKAQMTHNALLTVSYSSE